MNNVIHTKLGEGRRVAIPAELCRQYGLEPGKPVVLEALDSGIVVRSLETVVREVQDYFSQFKEDGKSAVDELIAERREEAARE